jgi:NAD(P)H-nitrite reductase large subunit
MHHLIIGAGPAGVRAAEMLRRLDANAEITLIDGEGEAPYSRMAIPYVLEGKIEEQGTWLHRPLSWYSENSIALARGRAAALDAASKQVKLQDGTTLGYDRLLVCTGARAMKPPVPGLTGPRVQHCWTLDDARAIMNLARPGARVVLMGAGFIGCIILEALVKRGVRLTVVEIEDRMVPRMLDEVAGSMLKRWSESKGVDVRTSTAIEEVTDTPEQLKVRLSDGEVLDADLLVVAAGVTPNIEFMEETGVERRAGVIVNARMETSLPDVWAAGDCAEGCDFSTGDLNTLAIQPVAVEQAAIAAKNMAGMEAEYHCALPMNVLDTLGLITTSFGRHEGVGGERAVLRNDDEWRYIRLEFDGDVLVGAQTAGHVNMIGVLRGLIQGRMPLKGWNEKLLKHPGRVAEAYVDLARNP